MWSGPGTSGTETCRMSSTHTHTHKGKKERRVEISSSFILPFVPITPSSLRVRLSLATWFTSWLSFWFCWRLLMTLVISEMSCRTSLDSAECVGLMSWTHSSRLLLAEPDPPPRLTPQTTDTFFFFSFLFFYLIIQAIFWRMATGRKKNKKSWLIHPAYKGSQSSMLCFISLTLHLCRL